MKKLTKLLLASALAFSAGSAAMFGFASFAKEEPAKAAAYDYDPNLEYDGGCAARPILVSSYQEFEDALNNVPNKQEYFIRLTASWTYQENANNHYISIDGGSDEDWKAIYLDLNGQNIGKAGTSVDRYWFYLKGNLDFHIHDDSPSANGSINMVFDGSTVNTSSIFYINGDNTLLHMSAGRLIYYPEYYGAQYAHDGNDIYLKKGYVFIGGGQLYAASQCVYSEVDASYVEIYGGQLINSRGYTDEGNRSVIKFSNNTQKVSDCFPEGVHVTSGSASLDLTKFYLNGGENGTYNVTCDYSLTGDTNLWREDYCPHTIKAGQEICLYNYVFYANNYVWTVKDENDSSIDYSQNSDFVQINDHIFYVKADHIESYVNWIITCTVQGTVDGVATPIHYSAIINWDATVTIINEGQATIVLEHQTGKTIPEVLSQIGFPTRRDGEYFIGFASKPMSEFETAYDFYWDAMTLLDGGFVVEHDLTLYGAWASTTPSEPTINIISNKKLNDTSDVQSLGNLSVSNLPAPSLYSMDDLTIPYFATYVEYETTNLVNESDATDVVPLNFYEEIRDAHVATYNSEVFELTDSYGNFADLSSIIGNQEFIYIDSVGSASDATNFADLIDGKIVLVNRGGGLTFVEKGNNLAAKNPAGILCVNIYDGTQGMTLDGYTGTMPYYSAVKALGDAIKASATKQTRSGTDYYTGTLNFSTDTVQFKDPATGELTVYTDPGDYIPLFCDFDHSLLTSGCVYKATITYKVTFYDSKYNPIDTERVLEQTTTLVVGDLELESISLSGTYPTEFEVGDSFSYEGLVVTAHYSDGTNLTVDGYVVSSPDMSTAGSKTITVSYTDDGVTKTATYQITVNEKSVTPPIDPETPEQPSKGLPAGAVVGIVIGSVLVASIGGFALVWFVIKKKTWADFLALFKKK